MGTFPDVPEGSTFEDDIEWLAEKEITTGDLEGNFRPNDVVKRKHMAAFLRRTVRLIDPALAEREDTEPPPGDEYDVVIEPGQDVQDILNGIGEGAVVGFQPGIFHRSIVPLSHQVLVSVDLEGPAIFDGGGTLQRAIHGSAPGVILVGLEIRNYASPSQVPAVGGSQDALHFKRGGWKVLNCHVHDVGAVGVLLRGNDATIKGGRIIRAGQLGFGIGFGYDGLAENLEVAYCNENDAYAWGFEAGGCKNWESDRLVIRNIWSHHNHGPGLWSDNANVDTLYENNTVEDNTAIGIFHEISHGCTIRGNTLRRNGHPDRAPDNPYVGAGGITLAQSGVAIVEDNLIDGDAKGIIAFNQGRAWSSHIGVTTGNSIVTARRNTLRNIEGVTHGAFTDSGNMPEWDWDDSNVIEYV